MIKFQEKRFTSPIEAKLLETIWSTYSKIPDGYKIADIKIEQKGEGNIPITVT